MYQIIELGNHQPIELGNHQKQFIIQIIDHKVL